MKTTGFMLRHYVLVRVRQRNIHPHKNLLPCPQRIHSSLSSTFQSSPYVYTGCIVFIVTSDIGSTSTSNSTTSSQLRPSLQHIGRESKSQCKDKYPETIKVRAEIAPLSISVNTNKGCYELKSYGTFPHAIPQLGNSSGTLWVLRFQISL